MLTLISDSVDRAGFNSFFNQVNKTIVRQKYNIANYPKWDQDAIHILKKLLPKCI